MHFLNAPKGQSHSVDELRKWFDGVELEKSNELSLLSRHISDERIKVPGLIHDSCLVELVNRANESSNKREDQRESIDLLEKYLEGKRREDDEERRVAEENGKKPGGTKREKLKRLCCFPRNAHHDKPITQFITAPPIANPSIITRSMINTFDFVCKVLKGGLKALGTTVFIASELTFQTHYAVAIKAITLLITTYENATDLTDDIRTMFDRINEYGAEMRALQENIRSPSMSRAINKLFISIVTFIVSASSYLKHGILHNMVMELGGSNEKLQDMLKDIRDDYAEVTRVMQFAQVMMNLATFKTAEEINKNTSTIIKQLSVLNGALTPEISRQGHAVNEQNKFNAELHVQNLLAELFDEPYEPSDEMAFNNSERIFLSPQDRWPRQFKLLKHPGPDAPKNAMMTQGNPHYPLLWISGHTSRRNVSWVSSLSVDIVSHFREFSNFDTAFVFCKRGKGSRYTPTLIIKSLIAQLLEAYPSVAMKNLRRLSLVRFSRVGAKTKPGSGRLAWELLDDTLRLIREVPESQNRAVLLLIDRLDLCHSDGFDHSKEVGHSREPEDSEKAGSSEDYFTVLKDLIPQLQNLGHRRPGVQVLITTARLPARKVPTLRRGSEWLREVG